MDLWTDETLLYNLSLLLIHNVWKSSCFLKIKLVKYPFVFAVGIVENRLPCCVVPLFSGTILAHSAILKTLEIKKIEI